MYRVFTIKDTLNNTIKFKVWPNLAPPKMNKLVYEKAEIELVLDTNRAMLNLIEVCNLLMNENTINKIIVDEIEE